MFRQTPEVHTLELHDCCLTPPFFDVLARTDSENVKFLVFPKLRELTLELVHCSYGGSFLAFLKRRHECGSTIQKLVIIGGRSFDRDTLTPFLQEVGTMVEIVVKRTS